MLFQTGNHASSKTEFKKGMTAWNKGKKHNAIAGEKNPMWKEKGVGYRTLHQWVQRHLGKASKCSNDINHKSTRYHWANISKEYLRDLSDWRELCPSCNLRDKTDGRVA